MKCRIITCLGYCNSFLSGLLIFILASKYILFYKELRIKFKFLTLACKVLRDIAPAYISNLTSSHTCQIHSTSTTQALISLNSTLQVLSILGLHICYSLHLEALPPSFPQHSLCLAKSQLFSMFQLSMKSLGEPFLTSFPRLGLVSLIFSKHALFSFILIINLKICVYVFTWLLLVSLAKLLAPRGQGPHPVCSLLYAQHITQCQACGKCSVDIC